MNKSKQSRWGHCAAALLLAAASLPTLASADPLRDGFASPPNSARPRVWWHWMNGNITRDGITKDLEWMKRVGIGGLQNFDANLTTPQIVDKRLVYMTPDWKAAFRHAASLADKLDLELAIAASPGWSETGGPWVPPADGMKKLVWSETEVDGGSRSPIRLAPPPSTTGPFQSLPMPPSIEEQIAGTAGKGPPKPGFYADAAVLAFPVTAAPAAALPKISDGDGKPLDAAAIVDPSLDSGVEIGRGSADKPQIITLTFATPRTIRSASFYMPGMVSMFAAAEFLPVLEAREAGGWRKIADLPIRDVPTTVSFAPVSAAEYRIRFLPNTEQKRVGLGEGAPGAIAFDLFGGPPAKTMKLAQLSLSGEAKVDRFEAKAGYTIARDYYALSRDAGPDIAGVAPGEVVDLTARLRSDGTLDWTPPKGRWRILRLGYSLLGTTNHPAPAEATGLEVDKYDGAAVRRYLDHYLGLYRDAAGPELIGAHGVRAMLTDSIEVGASNWTPALVARFKALRGYDPTPWLPALTGTIIGSRAASDAFLYDFRRTLADLLASDHYGVVADFAHRNGLRYYGEALEDQRPMLGDDMAMRVHADIPMAALWTYREAGPRPTLIGDMRGAASVAHVYGQNLVAAESMTSAFSPWAFAPSDLRKFIDLEFANGVNRPVIHTSVHQPVDDKVPGLSLLIFGQYFNRHESWAEMARPWVDYIARNSYLLQQGRNFADVAYFYGEEQPLTALYADAPLADTPKHYAWDFVNPDVLINRLKVDQGGLVAKSGARYRILYLGGTSARMTLPVLRRIAALAEAGATIVGEAPTGSPALGEDQAEYQALLRKLWPGGAEARVGSGRVFAGRDAEAALAAIGVGPDFSTPAAPGSDLLFVHRRLDDGDLYFVNNRSDRAVRVDARFRVAGKSPEIWHADTGASEPVSYRSEGDATVVPLDMLPEESFFLVFRKAASAPQATIAKPAMATLSTLAGPWDVAFQPGRGAPASTRIAALGSLSEQADPAIRYFSGTATYTRDFELPRGVKPGAPLWLDLGKVGDVAEVWVNGQTVGTVWHAPFRLDIGAATRKGANRLEIRVADLWVNRLIGDAQPGATKITFTAAPTYKPDAPLRPSGLIGPVTLLAPKPKR